MKTVNELYVSDEIYTLFQRTLFLFQTILLKLFIYNRVGILDSEWCKDTQHAYQKLGQGDLILGSSIRKKFPSFYLFTTYPQKI